MPPRSVMCLAISSSFALALVAGGCGADPDKPKLGKVQGTVKYKDQPVTSGSIVFTPVSDDKGGKTGQVASGQIGSDGSYELTTFNTGDGAILGQHVVTVQAFGNEMKDLGKPKPDGTFDYKLPKSTLPKKYTDAASSDLKYTVEPGTNKIDITLKD